MHIGFICRTGLQQDLPQKAFRMARPIYQGVVAEVSDYTMEVPLFFPLLLLCDLCDICGSL